MSTPSDCSHVSIVFFAANQILLSSRDSIFYVHTMYVAISDWIFIRLHTFSPNVPTWKACPLTSRHLGIKHMQYLGFMGLISPSSTKDAASRSSCTTVARNFFHRGSIGEKNEQSRIQLDVFLQKIGIQSGSNCGLNPAIRWFNDKSGG